MRPDPLVLKISPALCLMALAASLAFFPQSKAAAQENNEFFKEFNVFTGKWRGRGLGQRNAGAAKEVVSCKGIHRWLKKGRLFEQSYTCWGADFIFTGAFRLQPGSAPGLYKGISLNGAGEETGKVTGHKLESGILEFILKKNFSKDVNMSHLKVLENGHIDYRITSTDPKTGENYQALKIIYSRKLKT